VGLHIGNSVVEHCWDTFHSELHKSDKSLVPNDVEEEPDDASA
jgi:hypothetical protein